MIAYGICFSLSDLTWLSVVASGSIRVAVDGAVSSSSGLAVCCVCTVSPVPLLC